MNASLPPRAYSVVREYGGQPDRIALPVADARSAQRPGISLVSPLDEAQAPQDDGADRSEEGAKPKKKTTTTK